MRVWTRLGLAWLVGTLLTGCAGAPPASRTAPSVPLEGIEQGTRSTAPKRIVLGLPSDVTVLSATAKQGGPSGSTILEELLNAGLTLVDDQGLLHPQLAETVPTTDNGLWRVLPDGRMETTWKLKPGLKWHDGAPLTTNDLLFSAMVDGDKDVPRSSRPVGYEAVEGIEALDAQTIVLKWKRPFIEADRMFTRLSSLPMPRHILEKTYIEDKTALPQHPQWTSEFVGAGPYRLRELVLGSHLIMDANPDYVLGRPKIDEIEVKFVPDANALVANVLAGVVDLSIGGGITLSLDQAIQVRDQWREGKVELGPGTWGRVFPQLLNPTPAVVTDVMFRRAMYHAIDREQLVETLLYGLGTVLHSFMAPNQPQYRDLESRLMHYDYDPRRANQMIEGLGYAKGPDGYFRDVGGQRLTLELRATTLNPVQLNTQTAIADAWQRLGVSVEHLVIPMQRINDREYRSVFPGFEVIVGSPHDLDGIDRLHSRNARTPENNFVGSTHSRYMNPGFDALIDRYFVTVPTRERMDLLGQIMYHVSDVLNEMPLYYSPGPVVIANRLTGASAPKAPNASVMWNAHQWDVRG